MIGNAEIHRAAGIVSELSGFGFATGEDAMRAAALELDVDFDEVWPMIRDHEESDEAAAGSMACFYCGLVIGRGTLDVNHG